MTITPPNPQPPASLPVPMPEPAEGRQPWVVPVVVIALTVVLMACTFGAFLVHAYPVLKEPIGTALGIATFAGLVVSTTVILIRRR
ncbi:hypothetical protein OHT61_32355 (plasmid) [Streptomyces sp. NBC_00178]|uniref:hypothetical protein n=1 Tax=Streptomyces sp. NBC_00178 TaxID=2975672 RepID=UPI002E29DDFA|nr:hypothetical protein [Streptomyces sp. NBC_00178]